MRAVSFACLVVVGVGISDRPFFNGSFSNAVPSKSGNRSNHSNRNGPGDLGKP
jgi:hypothetical protein